MSANQIKLTPGNQSYLYVITKEGLFIARKEFGSYINNHANMARLKDVYAAGEVWVREGAVQLIDNGTGHYLVNGKHLKTLIENEFCRAGFRETKGKFSYYEYDAKQLADNGITLPEVRFNSFLSRPKRSELAVGLTLSTCGLMREASVTVMLDQNNIAISLKAREFLHLKARMEALRINYENILLSGSNIAFSPTSRQSHSDITDLFSTRRNTSSERRITLADITFHAPVKHLTSSTRPTLTSSSRIQDVSDEIPTQPISSTTTRVTPRVAFQLGKDLYTRPTTQSSTERIQAILNQTRHPINLRPQLSQTSSSAPMARLQPPINTVTSGLSAPLPRVDRSAFSSSTPSLDFPPPPPLPSFVATNLSATSFSTLYFTNGAGTLFNARKQLAATQTQVNEMFGIR